MKLSELFPEFNIQHDVEVSDIMYDSRQHCPNSVFFAKVGFSLDGHHFIEQAIKNGAVAIVSYKPVVLHHDEVEYIFDAELSQNYAVYLNRFYNFPSHDLKMIFVSGSSGKSVTSYFLYQLLKPYTNVSLINSDMIAINDDISYEDGTIMLVKPLQAYLADLVKQKVEFSILEVTDMAIAMKRVEGVDFKVGIFTTLEAAHLDYHLNLDNYYAVLASQFKQLEENDVAIVNIDQRFGRQLVQDLTLTPVITISMIDESASYFIKSICYDDNICSIELVVEGQSYTISTNCWGKVNALNLVSALACGHYFGYEINELILHCQSLQMSPGRYERISTKQGFDVIVDYANTPHELTLLLQEVKNHYKQGKILLVFGCVGSKEKPKRITMGSIADQYCDQIYLTEENSYDENTNDIIEQMAKGILKHPYLEIPERVFAIEQALACAKPHDVVLILGKGNQQAFYHHTVQAYEGDKAVVLKILSNIEEELYDKTK